MGLACGGKLQKKQNLKRVCHADAASTTGSLVRAWGSSRHGESQLFILTPAAVTSRPLVGPRGLGRHGGAGELTLDSEFDTS
jgi:hypothetical protein